MTGLKWEEVKDELSVQTSPETTCVDGLIILIMIILKWNARSLIFKKLEDFKLVEEKTQMLYAFRNPG